MSTPQRPLSPHLQIYKPQISSVLSILHRITGVGLFVGLLTFIVYLGALASGPRALGCFLKMLGSPLGLIYAFAVSVAVFYHSANGLRHLVWDAGKGYDLPTVRRTGRAVLVFTVAGTLVFWVVVGGRI